jgi:hypothetical protein
MSDPTRLTGFLLIAGGVLWFAIVTTGLDGTVVVPGAGVGFLVAYLATRRYGLLIPAGILCGLGTGLVVEGQGGPSGAVPLGLGLGFAAIAAVGTALGDGDAAWWPLIPGGILILVGGSQIASIRDAGIYLVPAALVVAGLFLLLRSSCGREEGEA